MWDAQAPLGEEVQRRGVEMRLVEDQRAWGYVAEHQVEQRRETLAGRLPVGKVEVAGLDSCGLELSEESSRGRPRLRHAAYLAALGMVRSGGPLRRYYDRLRAQGVEVSSSALRSVGYRQVCAYLDGAFDAAEMRERAIAATRQLAKRQLTWLRRWPAHHRLETGPQGLEAILKLL